MITGSECKEDTTGSTKDPTPAQDAPSQDAPVDDSESSEAKAASTSLPATNLTLGEGKDRAQAAKTASQKRADEGAAAAKKRAAPDSPFRESGLPKGYHNLFDSESDEAEEEGAVSEPQKISNDLDEQQERFQADQLQGALEEFTSLRKKPEDRGGLFPVWGYRWVQPENTTTQTQAEDLFWRWVSLKNFTVQELKELREDRLLSYVLDQRDLRIVFAHLVAKRQLHSVMEDLDSSLSPALKMSA
ncbi:Hypothetical protein PHPALM_9783, partial [Phytophthora palmivora]